MSKLTLYDFECPVHGIFEDMVQPGECSAPCPQCNSAAHRMISAPRIDMYSMALSDSASPGSINHFHKIHSQRKTIEDRSYREHGDYGNHAGGDGGRPLTPEMAGKL